MKLPDYELDHREILRHTGSPDQLYNVRRLQLTEGSGAGMRLIEVCTAAGMRAVFCESRALDLYELHFKGTNIGFLSKNNLINDRVRPVGGAFISTWPGGMLATCGLRNTGPDCEADGEYHPLHGLIGGMPAEQVAIKADQEQGTLEISGQMRESALFGHNLLLQRKITIPLQGSSISWHDTVLNQAAEPEPLFLLYHFNFGYPFLSPDLQLHFPPGQVLPRSAEAEKGLTEYAQISEPIDGYAEQVFFHLQLPGSAPEETVRLVRSDLRMAAALTWSRVELPWLIQWKSMKSGDYALGIEPSTSRIRGRDLELREGYDQVIKPFDKWHYHLRLELETLA
jgi:hypothetical protein